MKAHFAVSAAKVILNKRNSRNTNSNGGIMAHGKTQKPLEGILVVSVEQALAAPLCTGRLAELGARVIKIERSEGDFARGYDSAANGQASYFVWTNSGKESLVLDFKNEDDAALLWRIIEQADVFVQNLAPGALSRAGFDSNDLRVRCPRLITCDISGYGAQNPDGGLKAYDLLVQCESGLVGVSGVPEAPGRIGVSICDIGAGMNATIGILSALALRNSTKRGSGIAVSLFDGAADWMTIPYIHEVYGEGAPGPQGLKHPSIAPYGAYTTEDGRKIVISIQNEREWCRFCIEFLQQPDCANDPRFSSNGARVRHGSELDALIAEKFSKLDSVEALKRLSKASIAYGQVRSVAEMSTHAALRTWPMNVDGRELDMIAPPVQAAWNAYRFPSAPTLGEHSDRLRVEFAHNSAEAVL